VGAIQTPFDFHLRAPNSVGERNAACEACHPRGDHMFWKGSPHESRGMACVHCHQYMGCVSPIPNGPPVTNAVPGCTTPILTSNTPNPVGVASPFYPYFVVGDASAARYLFLGVDQPSYHAHTILATLEYRFKQ
jgi:hypothetical protein